MSKGDASKAQNQLDYRGNYAQNNLDNLRGNLLPQNQALQNRYNVSADLSNANYGQMYQGYNDLFNQTNTNYNNLFGQTQNAFQPQHAGYLDFATTGGFTPQNIQDIRARSVAPMRATYANAMADVDRQRALSGGISPNYNAAKAKMARELSYGLADASTNTEAMLAEAIRSGKLAGLGGLNATDTSQLGLLSNILGGQTQGLNETLGGQRSLYGTVPGATSMYGTQLGQSNQQMNEIQQLQNQLAQIIIQGQLGKSEIPSNYQQALGNISGTEGVIGKGLTLGMMPGNYGAK